MPIWRVALRKKVNVADAPMQRGSFYGATLRKQVNFAWQPPQKGYCCMPPHAHMSFRHCFPCYLVLFAFSRQNQVQFMLTPLNRCTPCVPFSSLLQTGLCERNGPKHFRAGSNFQKSDHPHATSKTPPKIQMSEVKSHPNEEFSAAIIKFFDVDSNCVQPRFQFQMLMWAMVIMLT